MLEMYKMTHNKHQMILGRIVTDDDSSIKAKLKWRNADHMTNNNTTDIPKMTNRVSNIAPRPDKGGMPGNMPEPGFLSDPNHRRNALANELYGLKKLGKQPNKDKNKKWNLTMTKMDMLRMSKNFVFMGKTLKNKTTNKDMLDSSKAVIEHHFDNDEHCGGWCRRRDQTEEERKKHYCCRCKDEDSALCKKLEQLTGRFITIEALKELAHSLDTNTNESFNQTISWMAP